MDGIRIEGRIFDMIIGRDVYSNENTELCRSYRYMLNSFSDACSLLVDFENDSPVGRIFRSRCFRGASSSFSYRLNLVDNFLP